MKTQISLKGGVIKMERNLFEFHKECVAAEYKEILEEHEKKIEFIRYLENLPFNVVDFNKGDRKLTIESSDCYSHVSEFEFIKRDSWIDEVETGTCMQTGVDCYDLVSEGYTKALLFKGKYDGHKLELSDPEMDSLGIDWVYHVSKKRSNVDKNWNIKYKYPKINLEKRMDFLKDKGMNIDLINKLEKVLSNKLTEELKIWKV